MTTKSKLTEPQKQFMYRVPSTSRREYFVLGVNYRESRVAFRAMRKLGWRGYYTGGYMYVWRHDESFLELAARKFFFVAWSAFNRAPKWANDEQHEKVTWFLGKFPEFQVHWIDTNTTIR